MGASGEARLWIMDLGASLRLLHLGAWRVRGIVGFFPGFSRLFFLLLASAVHKYHLSTFFFYYYSKFFHRKIAHCTQQPPPTGGPSQGRPAPFISFSSTLWTRSLDVLY